MKKARSREYFLAWATCALVPGTEKMWDGELSGCGVLSHVLGLVTISRTHILPGLYLEKASSGTPRGPALGLPSWAETPGRAFRDKL